MYLFLMESLSVSECGLCELPSSIHSDEETEHDAFFVQTFVEEVENAEYVAPLKPLLSMRAEDPCGRRAGPSIQAKGVCGLQEEVGGEKTMLR